MRRGLCSRIVNGNRSITGKLAGKDVVLFLSGISMVNAAMTLKLVLDRFEIERLVFSSIAGGVDPALTVREVVVAEQWGQDLEQVCAREIDGAFVPPAWVTSPFPPYGMMFVRENAVVSPRACGPEQRFWFPVDAGYLATAKAVAGRVDLEACNPANEDGAAARRRWARPDCVSGPWRAKGYTTAKGAAGA